MKKIMIIKNISSNYFNYYLKTSRIMDNLSLTRNELIIEAKKEGKTLFNVLHKNNSSKAFLKINLRIPWNISYEMIVLEYKPLLKLSTQNCSNVVILTVKDLL